MRDNTQQKQNKRKISNREITQKKDKAKERQHNRQITQTRDTTIER